MKTPYEEASLKLSNYIKKRVEAIARSSKVPHATIWSDLNILLSDIDAYREAIKNA